MNVLTNGKLLYKEGLHEYQPTIHTVFGTAMHEVQFKVINCNV
jgi:hypothetical protein